MAEVDLLVVNYNTRSLLQRLLDDLHSDDDGTTWNLYVADNGSSDGSANWLVNAANQYRIIQYDLNDNIGYARAINRLAACGESPKLMALNADVWLTTDDVSSLAARMDATGAAVVGPKQRNEQGQITHAGIFGENTRPKHRGWKQLDPNDKAYRDVLSCTTVSGSAYLVDRAAWGDMTSCGQYRKWHLKQFGEYPIGAFLETPHYWDETAFSYHVRHHGYTILYDGAVSIGHTWHAASEVGSRVDHSDNTTLARGMFRSFCDDHGIEHD